jgi:hypothetical protein
VAYRFVQVKSPIRKVHVHPTQGQQLTTAHSGEGSKCQRSADPVAPGTIQKEVAALKHALKLAVGWKLLQSNVAQGAKLPKIPDGRTRYLSPSELKAALATAPECFSTVGNEVFDHHEGYVLGPFR